MTTSLIDADSLLVIDVGSISTRAILFDVVEGRYRFLAAGSAPTTDGMPFRDITEGVRLAIDQLHSITGRILVGSDESLIIPSATDGSGVDTCAVTFSAGPAFKVVAVGLLEDVSLESILRLANTTYTGVIDSISLNDRRKGETRIDTIMKLRPDMVLVAGGTDGGASHSVINILEAVGLACYLMPENQRPEVLFAGNEDLQDEILATLGKVANVHFAANVRPNLETERLNSAQIELNNIFRRLRIRQINGVDELDAWSGGHIVPGASAFGRVIHFLSKAYASSRGVLGVDVGASATIVAAAYEDDLSVSVFPQLGLGRGAADLVKQEALEQVAQWLPLEIPPRYLQEYMINKELYPSSLPVTVEDMAIEQAMARVALQIALKKFRPGLPPGLKPSSGGLLPNFRITVASGSVLTKAPSLGQSLLMLLDGIQPTGMTTLGLDINHLAGALGAAAALNPILTVQVLDAATFQYLGTVISPIGVADTGVPILRVRMVRDNSEEVTLDVQQGNLEVLPLATGKTATLYLQPYHRYDVGMGGPGRGGKLTVFGGALGVIIDARGRPLRTSADPQKRQELYRKWLWALGG